MQLAMTTPEGMASPIPATPADSARPGGNLTFCLPRSQRALPHYIYEPTALRRDRLPLVTVHGISRNAREHALTFAGLAERSGRLVVAPFFGRSQCPRYQKVIVDDCRADHALMATLEEVTGQSGVATERIDLFGFSGGAQFAHRFALLHPDRVQRLALASAGWYSFPTLEEPFPYGFSAESDEGLHIVAGFDGFLQIPTLVLVGEQDVERDTGLRKGKRIDSLQGFTRIERAARWVQAIRSEARKREIRASIELQLLEGCGHSFVDCVARASLPQRVVRWFDA